MGGVIRDGRDGVIQKEGGGGGGCRGPGSEGEGGGEARAEVDEGEGGGDGEVEADEQAEARHVQPRVPRRPVAARRRHHPEVARPLTPLQPQHPAPPPRGCAG